MPLYLTVTRNGFFLFKSSEERGVQKSLSQDYFKASCTAGCGYYAKVLHGN